ncbi:unnamed protein product, partial [marine sediment metagenome]
CVLFDCAGLTPSPTNILDELAQQAAIEALQNSSVVIFCVDISKPDWAEDIAIWQLIEGPRLAGTQPKVLIVVATKCDLRSKDESAKRLTRLSDIFDAGFLATSVKAGTGIASLKDTIDRKLIDLALHQLHPKEGLTPSARAGLSPSDNWCGVALPEGMLCITARHRQRAREAIENISESIGELKTGNDEVTAMMLRAAYQAVSNIEQQNLDFDERILENIFSRFCIGK